MTTKLIHEHEQLSLVGWFSATDAIIKQQLSSLTFLSSQCDDRIEMLRNGVMDHIDCGLPVVRTTTPN